MPAAATPIVVAPIVMRLNRTWDITCPPVKKYVVAGQMVPTVKGTLALASGGHFLKRKRRLAIEIHGPEEDGSSIVANSSDKGNSSSSNTTTTTNDTRRRSSFFRRGKTLALPGRGLVRSRNNPATTGRTIVDLSKELKDDDRIVIRILKPRRQWGFSRDTDDSSSSSSSSSGNSDGNNDDSSKSSVSSSDLIPAFHKKRKSKEINDGWVEYRKYGLEEIDDPEIKMDSSSWEATLGLGHARERREIKFQSAEHADDFHSELLRLRALVKERASQRLEAYQKTLGIIPESIVATVGGGDLVSSNVTVLSDGTLIKSRSAIEDDMASSVTTTSGTSGGGDAQQQQFMMTASSEISLLIEIVSATDLPIADLTSTDPYVVVYLGRQMIHKTQYIPKDLNPIWSVDTGSLFIISQSAEDFFSAGYGLTFIVKDYDKVGANEEICEVSINAADLLTQTGERTSYELEIVNNGENTLKASSALFRPKLNLRIRKATMDDKVFLKHLQVITKMGKKKKKKKASQQQQVAGVYSTAAFIAPKAERVNFFKKEKKIVDGRKLYRVKPRPDPTRHEQVTKWMTAKQIDVEAMRPTYKWMEAGTGTLGKLYLEVIKCEGLPNLDSNVVGSPNMTDAFCCIIYEDAIVNTDVINDELNPRWMPWSQRGFVFNIDHPSSQILLGVLDYDSDTSVINHDAIGRITIDVTNFRADTEYLLTYDLYSSVLDDVRKTYGTITVRLRLEYDSYRDFVQGSLKIPHLNYINLPRRTDFLTSFFVCNGEENMQKLDLGAIIAYKHELMDYLDIFYYISQAALTVVLWRGHFDIGKGALMPIHSMVAFLMGIFVVENFNLIPAFSLFSCAWFLLATNEHRQRNPSPWHATMTFRQMWYALINNSAPPVAIADNENEAAVRRFEAANKRRQEEELKKAQEAAANARKLGAFLVNETMAAAEVVDSDLSTPTNRAIIMFPITYMIMFPIQRFLYRFCKALRIATSIVMWDESHYAFILVNACLALGIIVLFVPWSYFIRWTMRIVVWTFLGPWMKFVDIFYVQQLNKGEGNELEALQRLAEIKTQQISMAREAIMLQKEYIVKKRAMKTYMFGKYITRVPQFKEYRFPDVPRYESTATPLKTKPNPVVISKTSHGQKLVGDMIPVWAGAVDEENEKKE